MNFVMTKAALQVALTGICLILAIPAPALTLSQAIALAKKTDPTYQSAQATAQAAQSRTAQARGANLPQLSATVGTNRNRRDYETLDSPFPPSNDDYNSKSAQFNLSMPLWRHAQVIAVYQSEHAESQAEYQLFAAEQDLLLRLAQAWFDLMLARDMVVHAAGQVRATQEQFAQTSYAAKTGLASEPLLEEARFKHEQALAEQVVAESDQGLKLAALEQVIGVQRVAAPVLSDRLQFDAQRIDFTGITLERWLVHAERSSPLIRAAQRGVQAADDEVRKQKAGHEPTVDLVASYGNNGQRAGSFPGQNGFQIRQNVIGVQLNIPLSTGGTQNAKVSEAAALRAKAVQELELARRNARLAAKQAWFGWQASDARRTASQQAVRFSNAALQAAQAGQRGELKSALDVLQARQQLLGALRDTQRARYDMITNHLKLLASGGSLREADLRAIEPWLSDNPAEAALLRETAPGMDARP